ncbi:MAG: C45 family autoproteolytic acyltransferase/hydrolase [Isosphaeraceae bacterium]|nr:C45 family autoproteolytic acyltransferase/hydrolase [Isosphaeraceae bacterium]
MVCVDRRIVIALCFCALGSIAEAEGIPNPAPESAAGAPDPSSVERYGPAYRYPRAGWIVLHVEGQPYERGYQHGRLLAPEIVDYVKRIASKRSPKAPADSWREMRTLVNALFLRRYDKEYLEEMKGIADGAAAAGAKFDGRALDLLDIVSVNSEIEVEFLDTALHATADGLEGRRFPLPDDTSPRRRPPEHCSAFAANGPATADGKIVFGHITMFSIGFVGHFNVWLDVKPASGHRVLMQTYAGGIQSGMDYYMNDAGLLVAETTLAQTKFDIEGTALASRIRKALQYSDSIDKAVEILRTANNGMYTNEWLLADIKTNEIAMFELGTHKNKLWRSSKDEWFGGTKGFYWGCNNAKDLNVRLETVASLEGKPANVVFHPSDRDRTWLRLYREHRGKIGEGFGFLAFTTPPLSAFPSCDAKFTTSALAKDLKSWALFGPPLGHTWEPTQAERERYPDVKPLVPNDWTLLTPAAPAGEGGKAVDLASSPKRDVAEPDLNHDLPAAWRGTLLPKADADVWLAAAFADYERIVAREQAVRKGAGKRALNQGEQEVLDLDLFAPRSRYATAVARAREDVPLDAIRSDLTRDEWYDIAAGKGVLLLADLRAQLGDESFLKLLDDFGGQHAGQEVSTQQLRDAVDALSYKPIKPQFFDGWLKDRGLPNDSSPEGFWSIDSFEHEPEKALIVYGTLRESFAQREAAEILQRQIARRWSNVTVPIKSDRDATDDDLKTHHVLVVGRPDSNRVARKYARVLPVGFGPASFVLRGETYAHPRSAVVAAAANPLNPRFELVAFAGLSGEATRHCAEQIGGRDSAPAEVLLLASGAKPKRLALTHARGPKSAAR